MTALRIGKARALGVDDRRHRPWRRAPSACRGPSRSSARTRSRSAPTVGSAAAKPRDVVAGRLRRRIAAVGEGMHHRRHAGGGEDFGERRPHDPDANARRRAKPGPSGGRCRRSAFRRAIRSGSAGCCAISPLAMASPMRGRSCITTRPAPMLRWPTSELPIWPVRQADVAAGRCAGARAGRRPRAGRNWACCAWRTALSAVSSRQPQPSRMTSITGRRCCIRKFLVHRPRARSMDRPCPCVIWGLDAKFEPVLRDCRPSVNQLGAATTKGLGGVTPRRRPASQPSMARLRVMPQ